MTFVEHTAPQRTPDWYLARAGRLTGSRAADMLAVLKSGGEAAARRDYRMQLVCERLTGEPQDGPESFVNAAMQWGVDTEPLARAAYEARTGDLILEAGFCAMAAEVGASVDGRSPDWSTIYEIKCPKSATHLRYLKEGTVPADYLPQVTHNLWVTGAARCVFLSYDPRFPEPLRLLAVTHPRDEAAIAAYETKALAFLAEVETETYALRGWEVVR
jgi:putative phage-type endonuclease